MRLLGTRPASGTVLTRRVRNSTTGSIEGPVEAGLSINPVSPELVRGYGDDSVLQRRGVEAAPTSNVHSIILRLDRVAAQDGVLLVRYPSGERPGPPRDILARGSAYRTER